MNAKKRHSIYKDVFGSEVGRQVLLDLCKEGSVLRPTFDLNPNAAAFNEGRRAMILWILKYTNTDPAQLYAEMIRYNQEETNE